MSDEKISQAIEKLKSAAVTTDDPALRETIQVLGDAISVGDISGSTGVAIGRNIRMVINQVNLPADTVAALLDARNALGASLGLDPDRYYLGTFIADKTRDFVGREFVFKAIERFMSDHRCGYFTIEADPGLGKSAILAEYVRRTGCTAHFNVRALGITSAAQFL